MSQATNPLVKKRGGLVLPLTAAVLFGLGGFFAAGHSTIHAASTPSTSQPALDDHSVAALTALDQAMESVAARVEPAVVNIAVTAKATGEQEGQQDSQSDQQDQLPPALRQFFGQLGPMGPQSQPGGQQELEHVVGSGVILSPDGYILTNAHVVNGAVNLRVTLHDRRILNARVIGTDKLTDLAVLKVDARDLPTINWGDSTKLEPGQTVLAFGSPFNFQNSVTRGIVSAVDRQDPFASDARRPGGFIQTDAAINPGNSGGALVDAHGDLVGINNMIYTNTGSFQGAGFAIPAQLAQATAKQLIEHGKVDHGYLGISLNDVTPDNAHFFHLEDAAGAIVAQITPDSPASRAGLHAGDVIRKVNGAQVANGSALQVAVSELTPGTKIALGVIRDGNPISVTATLGEFGQGSQVAANGGPDQPQSGKLGLAVTDLNAEARQQLEVPDQVHGVVVERVRPASPAEDAGLTRGDIILEVDRHPTSSASQFANEIHSTANSDVLLLVWSRGNASYRTLRAPIQNG